MKKNIILTLMAILLLCCTACKKEEKKDIGQAIKAAELSTVRCTVRQVFKYDDPTKRFWGRRKVVGTVKATVTASIDLSKVEDEDIKEDGNTIKLTLPTPTIHYSFADSTINYIYEKIGALRSDFTIEDRNNIMKSCEDSLINNTQLLNSVIDDAKTSATDFFEITLTNLGYEKITIKFKDDPLLRQEKKDSKKKKESK